MSESHWPDPLHANKVPPMEHPVPLSFDVRRAAEPGNNCRFTRTERQNLPTNVREEVAHGACKSPKPLGSLIEYKG